MGMETVTYQCPNCGAALEFNNALGRFKCLFCDSEFNDDDIKRLFAKNENNALSAENQQKEEREAASAHNIEAEEFSGASALYSCPNCGAGVICDTLTASTRCHFCHTPVILTGRLSGDYKPDFIIPFGTTREQAESKFREFIKGKILLPNGFSSEATIKEITPLYVPYWLKSGTVNARAAAEGRVIRTWRTGNTEHTNTKIYDVVRAATMDFARVPCDGSRRIDDSLMESIEPFSYSGLKAFSMSYLSGCGAEKYDVNKDEAGQRIDERVNDAAMEVLKSDMTGYTSVSINNKSMSYVSQSYGYAMLPVWFLNYNYKGKDYSFAMNGQTGTHFGTLPVSRVKCFLLGTAVTVVLTCIFTLIGGFLFG